MKKILLVFIILLTFSLPVYADIPYEDAQKTYNVPFSDWAYVYLVASYKVDEKDYYLWVSRKMINEKTRFIIHGEVANTPLGKGWYENIGSKIAESIELQCKIWTNEGYSISLNDFEIDIKGPQGQ